MKLLILISRNEAFYLREHGMEKYVQMASKSHKSRSKTYYCTEAPRVLDMLYSYRNSLVRK